jgi:transposase-like protein
MLKPEQLTAIHYLAQPKYGGKTLDEIASECGVTPRTLYNWRRNTEFERELKKEMARRSQARLPELIDSLVDIAIRDGNAAMAKLALQVNGMLSDKLEIEQTTIDKTHGEVDRMKAEIDRYRLTRRQKETHIQ